MRHVNKQLNHKKIILFKGTHLLLIYNIQNQFNLIIYNLNIKFKY